MALVFTGFRLPPFGSNTGLWPDIAEEVGVEMEATGVSGEEDRDPGDEDLSCSLNEAVEDARSFDGTFECELDATGFWT